MGVPHTYVASVHFVVRLLCLTKAEGYFYVSTFSQTELPLRVLRFPVVVFSCPKLFPEKIRGKVFYLCNNKKYSMIYV